MNLSLPNRADFRLWTAIEHGSRLYEVNAGNAFSLQPQDSFEKALAEITESMLAGANPNQCFPALGKEGQATVYLSSVEMLLGSCAWDFLLPAFQVLVQHGWSAQTSVPIHLQHLTALSKDRQRPYPLRWKLTQQHLLPIQSDWLHFALCHRLDDQHEHRLELIQTLIQAKAPLCGEDPENDPIHYAAQPGGCLKTVAWLLDHGGLNPAPQSVSRLKILLEINWEERFPEWVRELTQNLESRAHRGQLNLETVSASSTLSAFRRL